MLAVAEPLARPKSEYFNRPLRDGRVFLLHFPALRAGLLSLSPPRDKRTLPSKFWILDCHRVAISSTRSISASEL